MRHVLVETNWVVGYAAPAHHRVEAACELVERAARDDLRLHVPAICLTEARRVLEQARFHPRSEADAIREYVRWAVASGELDPAYADVARKVVQAMEQKLLRDRADLPRRLAAVRALAGVEVFALSDAMLARSVEIASADAVLEPFDQTILAAVLVRGAQLTAADESEVCFVTLDRDLQPWDKRGTAKLPLVDWYDDAGVWVYADFQLTSPARPRDWPAPSAAD